MKIRRKYLTKDQRKEICKKFSHRLCKECPLLAKEFMDLTCVEIRKAQRHIDDYWEEEIEI